MKFMTYISVFILSLTTLLSPALSKSIMYNSNTTATLRATLGFYSINYALPRFDPLLGSLQGYRLYANGTDTLSGYWDISEPPPSNIYGRVFNEYISVRPLTLFAGDPYDYGDFFDAYYELKLWSDGFGLNQGFEYRLPQAGTRGTFTNEFVFSDERYVSDRTYFRELIGSGNVASVQWDFFTTYAMDSDTLFSNYMYSHVSIMRSWNMNFGIEYFYAVPEPAFWTMLIAGFGFTGAAMRHRRAAAIA